MASINQGRQTKPKAELTKVCAKIIKCRQKFLAKSGQHSQSRKPEKRRASASYSGGSQEIDQHQFENGAKVAAICLPAVAMAIVAIKHSRCCIWPAAFVQFLPTLHFIFICIAANQRQAFLWPDMSSGFCFEENFLSFLLCFLFFSFRSVVFPGYLPGQCKCQRFLAFGKAPPTECLL